MSIFRPCLLTVLCAVALLRLAAAQTIEKETPPLATAKTTRTVPIGFPQDAGPHDTNASIEWWYYNAFLTTEKGKTYAVIGSYFRTGIGAKKGHYLIYSLADLTAKKRYAYSILDKTNLALLKSFLPMAAMARPDDPRPMQLLAIVQSGKLPAPHIVAEKDTVVTTIPRFAIAVNGNALTQTTDDGRTWEATLKGKEKDFAWSLDLNLTQTTRPAMLAGSADGTGFLQSADQMYYLSLTRMDAKGTLIINGVSEKVTGIGWLDRQWGSPAYIQNYGWDWFGLQMDDGSEMILNRIRDAVTGKVVSVQATILDKDGKQTVEEPTVFEPSSQYADKKMGIAFPANFKITLPKSGYALETTPAFPEQTIPVLGVGTAIWEGVVNVTGTRSNQPVAGRGYMELVGYHPSTTPSKP